MIDEGQITIRNAGSLVIQRGLHMVGSFLFAVLVPRLLGPSDYGRFALVTSLYFWFGIVSDLGLTQVITRYVPYFRLQGEKEKLQKFFGNLLMVSLVSGALCACFYLLFTGLWLTDLDLFLLITLTVTLFIHSGNHPFFLLFLGLNQAGRWGMGEVFRHWLFLIFLLIGFYLNGLRGVLVGLFLTEVVVLAIGAYWGKNYFSRKELRLDINYLTPYLRFGLMYFISTLLSSISQHSGEVLVRLFYPDYVQVGYFGLAHTLYTTILSASYQFIIAFTPFMITLQAQGNIKALRQWIERLINWLTAGGMFGVFGVLLLGKDLVPMVLGTAYQPVAINLLPLFSALWFQILNQVAILLTLVYNRPKIALTSAGIRLVAVWCFGPFLVAGWGSLGGCLTILLAMAISAGYLTWRMQGVMTYSLRKWAWTIGLGFLFLPLLWFKSSWLINGLLYGVFAIGYCALLFLFRLITRSEIMSVWRILRKQGEIIH